MLSPEQQRELRAKMDAELQLESVDQFGQMMRELGIGRARPLRPRQPNPKAVQIIGKPLSEQLIEERR
ncbi:MAG TPA: hypothetical protein VIM11_23385 [Tepidisphaeraceae bacterium]|jgi:hypothetical protein